MFGRVPTVLRNRHAAQPVVLSDLARLLWLREVLAEGFEQAIWCDADLLILADFQPHRGDRFGRECWVQHRDERLHPYRKIHNAWMQFDRDSVTLPFYLDRASHLLHQAKAPVVPQFIGPKLLTAWHNIASFAVEERVGMLAPLVMAELLGRDGEATALLRAGHRETLCALNLSASFEDRRADGVCHRALDYERLIDGLFGDLPDQRLRAAQSL